MKRFSLSKILMLMALPFVMSLTSCKNDRSDEYPNIEFENGLEEVVFQQDETGGKTARLLSNRGWEITKSDNTDWFTVSPMEGSNNQVLTITVSEPNSGTTERRGTITAKINNSARSATITVRQSGSEVVVLGDLLYTENVGTAVAGNTAVGEYTGYQRGGELDQSGVRYSGSGASVRDSGANYRPETGTEFSNAPYVFMNGGGRHFAIENINVGDNTKLVLRFGVNNQTGYEGSPVFGVVDASAIKVYAGYDGDEWAELSFTSDGVRGWSWVEAQFAVASGTESIYIMIENLVQADADNQRRYDDFRLYEGGNGTVINPGGGSGDLELTTIKALNDRMTPTRTPAGEFRVQGIVVTDMANGNFTSRGLSIMDQNATGPGNGIYLFGTEFGTIEAPAFAAGDLIEVDLSSADIQQFRGTAAQDGDPYCNEIIISSLSAVRKIGTATLNPVTIQYNQINDYQGMYVQIENAQSKEEAVDTWVTGNTTHIFNINNTAQEFNVFTASATKFIGQPFLTGNGTIRGIAHVYGGNNTTGRSSAQLVPRDYSEVSGLTGDRVGGTTPRFGVTTQTVSVPATGGNATVGVTGNVNWTVDVPPVSAAEFLNSVSPVSGNGPGTITLDFKENTSTTNTNTVVIRISTTNTEVSPAFFDVTFTQAAASSGEGTRYTETFSTFTSTNNSYTAAAATGSYESADVPGITWNYAGTAHNQNDTKFVVGRYSGTNTNPGSITSSTISDGVGSITVTWRIPFNDTATGTSFNLYVNDTLVETFVNEAGTSAQTGELTVDNVNIAGNAVIRIESNERGRPGINGISWTSFE